MRGRCCRTDLQNGLEAYLSSLFEQLVTNLIYKQIIVRFNNILQNIFLNSPQTTQFNYNFNTGNINTSFSVVIPKAQQV